MAEVYRSTGPDSLAKACIETVLNPEVALGVVTLDDLGDLEPLEVGTHLRLDKVRDKLQQAWSERGYSGVVSPFTFINVKDEARTPHIDGSKGFSSKAPERIAVLSIARIGIGHVRGQQFDAGLLPGEARPNTVR